MLAPDENQVAAHAFRGNGKRHDCYLTERRLIVKVGRNEDSYAISKIAAVKIARRRLWAALIIGAILAVVGVSALASGEALLGIVLALGGAGLAYYGWRGKTALEIHHLGSDARVYPVGSENESLRQFIVRVNATLN